MCACSDAAHSSDEGSERSALLASALATFFKQVGYVNAKNISMQEKWPTFVAKDKKTGFFVSRLKQQKVSRLWFVGSLTGCFLVGCLSAETVYGY